MEILAGGVVYGIRLRASWEYRYIGLTGKTVEERLRKHFQVATSGRKTPFYDWLRKQNRDEVIADVLNWVDRREELGQAEIDWIAYLRREGHPLLNLSDGGLGPTGVEWTAEMREAARARSTGRKGLSRFGEAAPFFGHKHTEVQRLKWSADRRGKGVGQDNPNFGRFGDQHPSYGHTMSAEARKKLSEQRRGTGNPNYGRTASAETRAKMSAARKGRPMPSSCRSAHTRHHTNKGVYKPECQHCRQDASNNDATDC